MRCKLCQNERKLVKAHVIPRSFYKPMITGAMPPVMSSTDPNFRRKKLRIGIYDQAIVCAECEDRFNPWDNYACKLLLSKATPRNYLVDERGNQVGFTVASYDYDKLKLFFMSLLWRMAASSQYFFSQAKLGPHEEVLRKMILNADPGDEDAYSSILCQWDDPLGEHFLLYPHRQRYEDINYIRCYLNSYVVEIKVDKRATSDFNRNFMLKRGESLKAIIRELKLSHEYAVARAIAKARMNQITP